MNDISSNEKLRRALDDLGESDIPPMVRCAVCLDPECEGCQRPTSPTHSVLSWSSSLTADAVLPWEGDEKGSYLKRLVHTAWITAQPEQTCFESQATGSMTRALHFSLAGEALAISSFGLPWAVGFAALFPRVFWQLLLTPGALLLGIAIFGALVTAMVVIHALWALVLEGAIASQGLPVRFALAQRFAFYSCGWDLMASPAGFFLLWKWADMRTARSSLKSATTAPRTALATYLSSARQIPSHLRARVMKVYITLSALLGLTVIAALGYVAWQIILGQI